MQKRVMVIQDISCYGRCSLTVALPILSAAGMNAVPLPTAVLSAHTAVKGFTFRDLTGDMEPSADHWHQQGILFDAIYSGFLGSYKQIQIISGILERFRTKDTITLIDPAMADHGKMYAVYDEKMIKGMRLLLQKGDIVIPNMTEAAFLTGIQYQEGPYEPAYIEKLVQGILELGAKTVVLTGVYFDNNRLGTAVSDRNAGKPSYYFTEKITGIFHGSGDIFASAALAGLMRDMPIHEAARLAAEYTLKCIQRTVEEGQETGSGLCFEKEIPYFLHILDQYTH